MSKGLQTGPIVDPAKYKAYGENFSIYGLVLAEKCLSEGKSLYLIGGVTSEYHDYRNTPLSDHISGGHVKASEIRPEMHILQKISK